MYYTHSRPRHPRAGAAIGAAIVAAWLGAIGLAVASDSSAGTTASAAPGADVTENPAARPGRAGPGYPAPSSDR